MDDLRYIYPVARVRVLENRLLKKEILLNILAAEKLDLALRIISQTPSYNSDVLNIRDSESLNTFINLELQRLYKLAGELFIEVGLFQAYTYLKKDLSKSHSLIMQSESQILKDFIKRLIDLYNIKTFLRINYQKKPTETLKANLIGGGYIPEAEFINSVRELHLKDQIFSNGLNQFGKPWEGDYRGLLKDGLVQVEKNGSFSILEHQIDEYLAGLLRPARYMFFGPEPVFGYCLAKENELKSLRLILLAKINNISAPQIQERLTLTYAQ